MARAIWKGAINFGLVHIPVSLWKATRPQDIRFHMLHEKDLAPVRQKKVCSVEHTEIATDEIVKGYEISKGEFVTVEPEELDALAPENSHSIDIEDFVELAEVDPIYYETAYYLSPDKGAAKPYSLLVAAMEESGKAAIARFVMRTKQHLVLMRPVENAITMSTLYYADEVMPVSDVPAIPKSSQLSEQELQMAVRLIESMSRDFDPDRYEDTYREKVVEMLEQKAHGKKISIPRHKEEPARVIDLVSALQASLGEAPPEKVTKAKSTKKAEPKTEAKPAKKSRATKKKSVA
jgi:DNA end-binding protein Ku